MDEHEKDVWQFNVNIPKLTGYKTLAINLASFVYMVLAIMFPGKVAPDPATLGIAYDQFIAALGAGVTFVNMVLRLLTSGPVPPAVNVLGTQPSGKAVKAVVKAARVEGQQEGWNAALEQVKAADDIERDAVRNPASLGAAFAGQSLMSHLDAVADANVATLQGYINQARYSERGEQRWGGDERGSPPETKRTPMTLGAARVILSTPSGAALPDGLDAVIDEARRIVRQADRKHRPDCPVTILGHLAGGDACDCDMRDASDEKMRQLAPHYEDQVSASGAVYAPGTADAAGVPLADERVQPYGVSSTDEEAFGMTQPKPPKRMRPPIKAIVLAFLIPFLTPSLGVMVSAGVVLGLTGCSTVQQINAVDAAETMEQRAFALYGSYVTLQERAADVVRDRSVPQSVRRSIQQADRLAHPAAQAVLQGVREVAATRRALAAIPSGESTERAVERVRVVTAALQRSVTTLAPRIEGLTRAIAAARG